MGDWEIWVCSIEDLIIQKMYVSRGRDLYDVEELLIAHHEHLDTNYVETWLTQFAEALRQPGYPHRIPPPPRQSQITKRLIRISQMAYSVSRNGIRNTQYASSLRSRITLHVSSSLITPLQSLISSSHDLISSLARHAESIPDQLFTRIVKKVWSKKRARLKNHICGLCSGLHCLAIGKSVTTQPSSSPSPTATPLRARIFGALMSGASPRAHRAHSQTRSK